MWFYMGGPFSPIIIDVIKDNLYMSYDFFHALNFDLKLKEIFRLNF